MESAPGQSDHPDHIDLFVLPTTDAERLWTFELPREFADILGALPQAVHERGVTVALKRAPGNPEVSAEWPAVRKADHRRLYWEYTGVIAPRPGRPANETRGALSELGRGWLDWREPGSPPEGVPLRLSVLESQNET